MRLPVGYPETIRAAARAIFGPTATVRLFGSRADDMARGGDIDLHIEADQCAATLHNEIAFRSALWRELDEEQVDVVVMARGGDPRWIDRAALRQGVVL